MCIDFNSEMKVRKNNYGNFSVGFLFSLNLKILIYHFFSYIFPFSDNNDTFLMGIYFFFFQIYPQFNLSFKENKNFNGLILFEKTDKQYTVVFTLKKNSKICQKKQKLALDNYKLSQFPRFLL